MDALSALGVKYNTDKSPWAHEGRGHSYTPWYNTEFNRYRSEVKRVFELGINDGASVYMWEEYFPNAAIYAADNHTPGVNLVNRGRIKAHYVDQHDAKSLVELRNWLPEGFDLMIDDGNHDPDDQILTVNILADRLAPGGYYVIEDVQPPRENIVRILEGILWPWTKTVLELGPKSDDRLIVLERPI
jgi:hypothetical protein